MDTLQILTLKTATAMGRLADLQRRAEHAPEKASPVIKPALRELTTALEELQVANDGSMSMRKSSRSRACGRTTRGSLLTGIKQPASC
jgi:hypothetical protein